MENLWIPFSAALLGAVIGSLTSLLTILIQTRSESRREFARLAVEAAMADKKMQVDQAPPGAVVYPLATYVHYYARFLHLLQSRKFSLESYKKMNEEQESLLKIIEAYSKKDLS